METKNAIDTKNNFSVICAVLDITNMDFGGYVKDRVHYYTRVII